ncbi:MAG TPA: HD domain-containing phosphohydrolase, partial [Methylophilaceae bacterium]|nr:HD domain-containing phosphohydrolase [Methylophilaceae bacterium]
LKAQRENDYLQLMLQSCGDGKSLNYQSMQNEITAIHQQLDDDKQFIRRMNIGTESMREQDQERVMKIANYDFVDSKGKRKKFLSDDEAYNLTIPRGTLTTEERAIINNHISVTISMLESLPYPKDLMRVPEYAGGHHERMDGKGYPKGLKRHQMSIPARMMGIADIFEALTSKDRPYKKAKTLSETLMILGKMKLEHHIDPDIFDLFVREKIYLRYAEMFLEPSQIDEVDESRIPGHVSFGVINTL